MKTYILSYISFESSNVVCMVRAETEEKARKTATYENPFIFTNWWDVTCLDEFNGNYCTIIS